MTEKQLIKTVNTLLIIGMFCLGYGLIEFIIKPHTAEIRQRQAKHSRALPEDLPEGRTANPILTSEAELRNYWQSVSITYTTTELDYLGRYFVTSYCPEECGGSWMTSSGATCHYSSAWDEPTTCAIDRSLHGYNELIQVGDPWDANKKIYVTEDTGPGVRGAWVDCFVETMSEVRAWPTGWRNVYAVSYENHFLNSKIWREYHELTNVYLHFRGGGPGLHFWDDPRVDA